MSRYKLTAADRRKGQQSKQRKRRERPQRLKDVEKRMALIEKRRKAEADPRKRAGLIREIAALGIERKEYQD